MVSGMGPPSDGDGGLWRGAGWGCKFLVVEVVGGELAGAGEVGGGGIGPPRAFGVGVGDAGGEVEFRVYMRTNVRISWFDVFSAQAVNLFR